MIPLLLLLLLPADAVPESSPAYGAYALPDARGTRIVVLAPLENPAGFHAAVCGGRWRTVKYVRRQEGREVRRTSARFEGLAGDVYQIQGRAVKADEPCFVAAPRIASQELLGISKDPAGVCPSEAMEAAKGRRVEACVEMGAAGQGRTLWVAVFERQGRDVLASVVLREPSGFQFADFAATAPKGGGDTWRVGDEGKFPADDLHPLFLLRGGDGYILGLSWPGEEGHALRVYQSAGGRFREVLADYWYWLPE